MKFSIIIPTYNRAHTILRAINSCLSQTYKDFEIIVVDDGSTDSTAETLKEYIIANKITYLQTQNCERGAARNKGIMNSTGTYITFLDSDDIYYQNYLLIAFQIIQKDSPIFFHQTFEMVNEKLKPIRIKYREKNLLKGNFMGCMGVFVKRELILTNLFNEDRILAGSEDYELWLRLYAKSPFKVYDHSQAAIIVHSQRSELNIDLMKFQKRIELLIKLISEQNHFKTNELKTIISNIRMYAAINLLENGHIKQSLNEFFKAIKEKKRTLRSYKTAVFLFHFAKKQLKKTTI